MSSLELRVKYGAGMNNVITSFLNSSIVNADMNSIAANLAGISNSLHSTPFLSAHPLADIGMLTLSSISCSFACLALSHPVYTNYRAYTGDISASVKAVSSTLKATVQTADSKVSQAAEQQLADQIMAANSNLHSAAEDIAGKLPKNNSILYVSGKSVQLCPSMHANNTLTASLNALAY